MELSDDLVVEIISYLPLKFVIQCKVLSKNFNTRISDLKFSQIWFPHQKISSALFFYNLYWPKRFNKISINPLVPTTYSETIFLPFYPSVLTSCKGLILLEFHELRSFCVFNPITGEHQFIPYHDFETIGDGLAVDYPTSHQYKLVTFNTLAEQEGYKFHVFSSEGSGEWHEIQFRITFNNFTFHSKPVYVNDSLHWLRSDGRVLAFNTKREEAIILDLPEFINHHNPIFGIRLGRWLGISKGLLTLFCIFKKSIVVAAYDYISSNWRVTHTSDNVITGHVNGYIDGFPIWIDSKQVLFLQSSRRLIRHQYLYEYDSETNGYKKAEVLNKDYMINGYLCSFEPTLASVHTTFLDTVHDKHRPAITATLDELQRFITEGIR